MFVGFGLRVGGRGFRIQGSGFWVQGSGGSVFGVKNQGSSLLAWAEGVVFENQGQVSGVRYSGLRV
jgi:hypothetical protein